LNHKTGKPGVSTSTLMPLKQKEKGFGGGGVGACNGNSSVYGKLRKKGRGTIQSGALFMKGAPRKSKSHKGEQEPIIP